MPSDYGLYVASPVRGLGMTTGSKNPIIVLDGGFVGLLGQGELRALIAHELGHILSDHVLYTTALCILLSAGPRIPFFFGLPFQAVQTVLLEWSWAAELSYDRGSGASLMRSPSHTRSRSGGCRS
jgi:Zn-dependent protease with chaperone function